MKRQKGAATLVISITLIVIMTLLVMFSASSSIIQQKLIASQKRAAQAFAAAQAGIDHTILYFEKNYDSLGPTLTYLARNSIVYPSLPLYPDANLTDVQLPNGSKFSATLQVTGGWTTWQEAPIEVSIFSTGKSDDNLYSIRIHQSFRANRKDLQGGKFRADGLFHPASGKWYDRDPN